MNILFKKIRDKDFWFKRRLCLMIVCNVSCLIAKRNRIRYDVNIVFFCSLIRLDVFFIIMNHLASKSHHIAELLNITKRWPCSAFRSHDQMMRLGYCLLNEWRLFVEWIEVNRSPGLFRGARFSMRMLALSSCCAILTFFHEHKWILWLHQGNHCFSHVDAFYSILNQLFLFLISLCLFNNL